VSSLGSTFFATKGMNFNAGYIISVTVENNPEPPSSQWAPLESVPYALNAQRVGGIDVSPVPVNNTIFPIPLDGSGKIDSKLLPAAPLGITTINNIPPAAGGDFSITAGSNIVITSLGHGIKIGTNGSGAGITKFRGIAPIE